VQIVQTVELRFQTDLQGSLSTSEFLVNSVSGGDLARREATFIPSQIN
jgi:hypothetical protein